jgi:hypothetical protein
MKLSYCSLSYFIMFLCASFHELYLSKRIQLSKSCYILLQSTSMAKIRNTCDIEMHKRSLPASLSRASQIKHTVEVSCNPFEITGSLSGEDTDCDILYCDTV